MIVDNLNQESYEILIAQMKIWQKAYDEGHPMISDEQWDSYYWELIQMESNLDYANPESPTQRIIYDVMSELQKVEHNHPMLSLEKKLGISKNIICLFFYINM